jgi:hypothetical protein
VLDPLFGIVDDGEAEEFAAALSLVAQSGVKLHFIVINSDQTLSSAPLSSAAASAVCIQALRKGFATT